MSTHKSRTTRTLGAVAVVSVALALTACANRSDVAATGDVFPSKTITFLTPTSAGGATDLTARTLAKELEDEFGVSVVVENRPGGAGSVGIQYLAGTAADGYTIAVLPVEVSLLGHQGYDIDPADFDFIAQANSQPGSIAVPVDSPFQTLDELIVAAEADPGSISISNAGPGSIWNLGATDLGLAAGVEFTHVPFDGGAPAVTAAVGGQVNAVVAGIGETAPAQKDGRLRVLAVLTDDRVPALPDVPTATELGFDVVIGSWAAIGAPAGVPTDVVATLEAALKNAIAAPAYVEFIESGGNIPFFRSAADTTAFVQTESERFASLLAGS
ncbi:tripartite tricarboxylate transporter substrate binding protein [Cryobacterium melibiosiphilum]|uniref:Tripartite tricarboxylate transporter substrate binding protein n=2 Tax=Cryobacterium melibiosiphilum TaxID=995039 RepID=A0A3A5MJY8_9MICO|nr:tripartite tricarboxylate transporter substrate binding protein [Cryobacterium melibiosiphilum]